MRLWGPYKRRSTWVCLGLFHPEINGVVGVQVCPDLWWIFSPRVARLGSWCYWPLLRAYTCPVDGRKPKEDNVDIHVLIYALFVVVCFFEYHHHIYISYIIYPLSKILSCYIYIHAYTYLYIYMFLFISICFEECSPSTILFAEKIIPF